MFYPYQLKPDENGYAVIDPQHKVFSRCLISKDAAETSCKLLNALFEIYTPDEQRLFLANAYGNNFNAAFRKVGNHEEKITAAMLNTYLEKDRPGLSKSPHRGKPFHKLYSTPETTEKENTNNLYEGYAQIPSVFIEFLLREYNFVSNVTDKDFQLWALYHWNSKDSTIRKTFIAEISETKPKREPYERVSDYKNRVQKAVSIADTIMAAADEALKTFDKTVPNNSGPNTGDYNVTLKPPTEFSELPRQSDYMPMKAWLNPATGFYEPVPLAFVDPGLHHLDFSKKTARVWPNRELSYEKAYNAGPCPYGDRIMPGAFTNAPYHSREGWELEKKEAYRRLKTQVTINWLLQQNTGKHLLIANRLKEILLTTTDLSTKV